MANVVWFTNDANWLANATGGIVTLVTTGQPNNFLFGFGNGNVPNFWPLGAGQYLCCSLTIGGVAPLEIISCQLFFGVENNPQLEQKAAIGFLPPGVALPAGTEFYRAQPA